MAEDLADLIGQRFGLPTEDGRGQPADGPLGRFLRHRTHRSYADRAVPDELLRTLLACALSAPSKSDLQQVAVVVVDDAALRGRIAALLPAMPWVAAAPRFLVFCGDNRRIRRICALRGKPFANDHLDSFLNAATDAALVLQSFVWAAEAAGLGCCPISVIRNHAAEVGRLLALPAHVFPYAGLCVGYPARRGHVSLRLPMRLTVHVDRYDDGALEAEVDAYDRRRYPPSEQRHVDLYGRTEPYGWSEDKARQVSLPERADLGAYIRRQGFNLD